MEKILKIAGMSSKKTLRNGCFFACLTVNSFLQLTELN